VRHCEYLTCSTKAEGARFASVYKRESVDTCARHNATTSRLTVIVVLAEAAEPSYSELNQHILIFCEARILYSHMLIRIREDMLQV
jgi:hypothetical protein